MTAIKVIDAETQDTLPGAAVAEVRPDGTYTGAGASTDANGIALVPPGLYEVSFLGYNRKPVEVGAQPVTVALIPGVFELPEVEVVGGMSTRKKVAIGAGVLLLILLADE